MARRGVNGLSGTTKPPTEREDSERGLAVELMG